MDTFCGLHLQTFIEWLSCTILLLDGNDLEQSVLGKQSSKHRSGGGEMYKMVSCWISMPTHI